MVRRFLWSRRTPLKETSGNVSKGNRSPILGVPDPEESLSLAKVTSKKSETNPHSLSVSDIHGRPLYLTSGEYNATPVNYVGRPASILNGSGDMHRTSSSVSMSPLGDKYVFLGAPSGTALCVILTQVCGGPLNRALIQRTPECDILVLEFLKAGNATVFKRYVDCGKLVVAGVTLRQEGWYFTAPSPRAMGDLARLDLVCSRHTASRSLRFFRSKLELVSHIEPSLDIRHLRGIFELFGGVVRFIPMLYSGHIAFSIDYDSVRSSSEAIVQFQRRSDTFSGYHSWHLEFTDDPCDRPCIFL